MFKVKVPHHIFVSNQGVELAWRISGVGSMAKGLLSWIRALEKLHLPLSPAKVEMPQAVMDMILAPLGDPGLGEGGGGSLFMIGHKKKGP